MRHFIIPWKCKKEGEQDLQIDGAFSGSRQTMKLFYFSSFCNAFAFLHEKWSLNNCTHFFFNSKSKETLLWFVTTFFISFADFLLLCLAKSADIFRPKTLFFLHFFSFFQKMSVLNAFLCINENQIKSRVISNFLSHLQFAETDEELHRNTFFSQVEVKRRNWLYRNFSFTLMGDFFQS